MKPANPPLSRGVLHLLIAASLALLGTAHAADGASAPVDAEFSAADTDRDERLSVPEFLQAMQQRFVMQDANRDGRVTLDEMQASMRQQLQQQGPDAAGRQPGQPDARPDALSTGPSAAQRIRSMDTDNDESLTAAEHAAASSALFQKMDLDRDGALSRAEFAAGQSAGTSTQISR